MAVVKNICLEAIERRCASGDTGRLDLRRGSYEGQIFMRDSLIVHAQLAGLEGVLALFRLFDWGDAEATWQAGIEADRSSLHLSMETACALYAENLQDRAEMEARERERIDQTLFAPELMAGQAGGIESVLKSYTVILECSDKTLLPDGFTLSDASKSSYVIGSGEDCDVVLRHPTIDPLHCGVILEKGSVLIWDLGANSGVKINGTLVTQDILRVGDVMTLGAVNLYVRFLLRRPSMNRPKAVPVTGSSTVPAAGFNTTPLPLPRTGPPSKIIPKGPITYAKVSRQLKHGDKPKSVWAKLFSLFSAKKNK